MTSLLILFYSLLPGFVSDVAETHSIVRNQSKFRFSQAWVWQYHNDWIQPGEVGHSGDVTIYYDSLSRAWLFDAEAFGSSGEGFDFILGAYDGQYTFCFKDDKGKKRRAVRSVSEILSTRNDNHLVSTEFSTHNKETDKTKVFGKNIYGWPVISGKEYLYQYLKTDEKTVRYLAESIVDFQSIVYFNFLEGEVKLPVHFPTDIPVGKVLLEDSTTYNDNKKIILRLKEITDTDYQIDLSKYK